MIETIQSLVAHCQRVGAELDVMRVKLAEAAAKDRRFADLVATMNGTSAQPSPVALVDGVVAAAIAALPRWEVKAQDGTTYVLLCLEKRPPQS